MLKPLNKNIIVTIQRKERKTASGIYLSENSGNDMTDTGIIVAVGRDISSLSKGDTVIFPKGIGVEINHEGNEYLILGENNILAVAD